MRNASRAQTIRVVVIVLLVLGSLIGLWLVNRDTEEEKQQAEGETVKAETEADQLKAIAEAFRDSLRAQCREGIKSACHQLRGLDDFDQVIDEIQDAEIQDAEIQEGEVQEPEVQEPERQEREHQDPEDPDAEPDDPEAQDDEVQEPEVQDPEEQEPENQDPEVDDPDPNDPDDPPDTYTFHDFPMPGQTTTCTRVAGTGPNNPEYTCVTSSTTSSRRSGRR